MGQQLSTRNLKLPYCCKLSVQCIGPFRIVGRSGSDSYRLALPRVSCIYPTFHSSLLKPVRYSPAHPPTAVAIHRPPSMQEGSRIYQVRALQDSCQRAGVLQYLVDWESFVPEERSWVRKADVLDPVMAVETHRLNHSNPALRPGAVRGALFGLQEAALGGGGDLRASMVTSNSHITTPLL